MSFRQKAALRLPSILQSNSNPFQMGFVTRGKRLVCFRIGLSVARAEDETLTGSAQPRRLQVDSVRALVVARSHCYRISEGDSVYIYKSPHLPTRQRARTFSFIYRRLLVVAASLSSPSPWYR